MNENDPKLSEAGRELSENERKEPEASPLARRKGESELAHRALLIYAMQTPNKRNMRATARAVEKANSTVRGWLKKFDWEDRITRPTSDAEAQQLYRALYFEKVGMREIAMIEKNIVSPISVVGNTTRPIADTVKRTIEETKPPPKSSVFEDEIKRKHLALVDASIGYIAQGLKSGDLRRSLRDLPLLMTLRREITGEGKEEEAQNAQPVIESARVRYAKSVGGDIVEAMYEDAQELVAILGALAFRGKAPSFEDINTEETG